MKPARRCTLLYRTVRRALYPAVRVGGGKIWIRPDSAADPDRGGFGGAVDFAASQCSAGAVLLLLSRFLCN